MIIDTVVQVFSIISAVVVFLTIIGVLITLWIALWFVIELLCDKIRRLRNPDRAPTQDELYQLLSPVEDETWDDMIRSHYAELPPDPPCDPPAPVKHHTSVITMSDSEHLAVCTCKKWTANRLTVDLAESAAAQHRLEVKA